MTIEALQERQLRPCKMLLQTLDLRKLSTLIMFRWVVQKGLVFGEEEVELYFHPIRIENISIGQECFFLITTFHISFALAI